MKKFVAVLLMVCAVLSLVSAADGERISVSVLIMPKFENGEMSGDFPGEAQYYYENYVEGGEAYDIPGGNPGQKFYYKDGVALYITGVGKVATSNSLTAVLLDPRFDFSDCYFISTGCAGSAVGSTVMGDVFINTAAIDFDLGHHADPREMADPSRPTWFHDPSYDSTAFMLLDQDLMDRIYELVKDTELETTEKTRAFMAYTFDNAEWATRDPMVLRGTTVTGDNYWKGYYDHQNAVLQCETYGAPDPFTMTEMEDAALAVVLDRFGLLDRYIIIRDSVNMDVFMNGVGPELLWDPTSDESLSNEDSIEAADIFATAMENNYKVGSQVIDAILAGTL